MEQFWVDYGVESQKYTYLGRTVNLASRLESKAGSGEILIDSSVYENVAEKVSLIGVKHYVLKGFKRSITIYSVTNADNADKMNFLKKRP